MDSAFRQPVLLFEREGARFEPVEGDRAGTWLTEAHVDRSMVTGDLDLDGDVDLVIGELNGPLRVIENDGDKGGWLIVALREREGIGNRHGVGSMIELTQGDRVQRRWVVGGGGFQSASSLETHFGLGDAPGLVSLSITWPDGAMQRVEGVEPNQRLVVRRR